MRGAESIPRAAGRPGELMRHTIRPMPEGDTIFRTAAALRAVLVGRRITRAATRPRPRTPRPPDVTSLVGSEVTDVRSVGKHLLITLGDGRVLHSHLGMTGSWHRYAVGAPWQRPERQASVILETPDSVAVCFSPAQLTLFGDASEAQRMLGGLGPDLLDEASDGGRAATRLRATTAATVGEALLDQRVMAGIGNVYRSEVLFLCAVHPTTPVAALDDERVAALVDAGRRLLRANTGGGRRSTLANGRNGLWVYGRAGRPCRRCGTLVRSARLGESARLVYWCPACQPEVRRRSG